MIIELALKPETPIKENARAIIMDPTLLFCVRAIFIRALMAIY
ncbi:MAG: hypothetical protein V5A47_06530 [Bacteroidales bacterium]